MCAPFGAHTRKAGAPGTSQCAKCAKSVSRDFDKGLCPSSRPGAACRQPQHPSSLHTPGYLNTHTHTVAHKTPHTHQDRVVDLPWRRLDRLRGPVSSRSASPRRVQWRGGSSRSSRRSSGSFKNSKRRGRSRQRSRGLLRRVTPLLQRGEEAAESGRITSRAGVPEPLPGSFLHQNERISVAEAPAEGKEGEAGVFCSKFEAKRPTNGLNRAGSRGAHERGRATDRRRSRSDHDRLSVVLRRFWLVFAGFCIERRSF